MKFTKQFNDFLRGKVNLNTTRLSQLQDRVDAITSALDRDDELGEMIQDTHPQGSWAHGTIIRPQQGREFDADFMLQLTEIEGWEPKYYIAATYRALNGNSTYAGKVSRKSRCVRVQYAGQCHVDVVPFISDTVGGRITSRTENTFEATDPSGFTEWYADKNAITNGHLKRVIRLVKYLRDIKGTFTLKSVLLTTLLGDRVSSITAALTPEKYADVPTTLKTLMCGLADYLDQHPSTPPSVKDPSGMGRTFDHRWDPDTYPNLVERVRYYADKIEAAYEEDDRLTSMALWRDVFGDAFGEDLAREASQLASVSKSAATRAPDERFIDEPPYSFPISLDPRFRASITARVLAKDGFRDGDLAAYNYRVQPYRRLRFKVQHDVPGHVTVYWKVRNRGAEARTASCLRGEITRDDRSRTKHEPTRYRGDHYVEAYVIKDGECVAMAQCPVKIV